MPWSVKVVVVTPLKGPSGFQFLILDFVFVGWVFWSLVSLSSLFFLVFVAWNSGSWCDFWSSWESLSKLGVSLLEVSLACLLWPAPVLLNDVAFTWAAEICSTWCGLCLSGGSPLALGAELSSGASKVVGQLGPGEGSQGTDSKERCSSTGRQVTHQFWLR